MSTAAVRFRSFAVPGAALLFLAIALLVACTRTTPPPQVAASNPACPSPQSIPVNYDYPQDAKTVEGWVANRDEANTRAHGWNLWAALNQIVGGTPVWKSWCTETQAFADYYVQSDQAAVAASVKRAAHGDRPMRTFKLANGSSAGSDPINFPNAPVYAIPPRVMDKYQNSGCVIPPSASSSLATLANGITLQNNGDVMVAGVIYNQPAYDWIRQKKLYDYKTLTGLLPPPGAAKQMTPMPIGSIVLKPMMWPVQKSGFTALPIWDDAKSDDGVYAGFENQTKWTRAVAITPTPQSTLVPASVSFLHGVTMHALPLGPNTYANPRVVGVQDFYHYQPDLSKLGLCDRAILDASAWYAYGRMFEQGDYLVLVAMHVMTKEQPAWTFQSVWWHDQPNAGPYAANRPSLPQAQGPWAHYLMTSTYGMPAVKGGKQWPVAYNPYIELAADHPIVTNCMNCHHRAAWPATSDEYKATGGPGALDIFDEHNPIIFNGKIGVDALWSISDRVPSPSPGPAPSPAPTTGATGAAP